jgi:ubiquitin-conjugating enzyme E2 Q
MASTHSASPQHNTVVGEFSSSPSSRLISHPIIAASSVPSDTSDLKQALSSSMADDDNAVIAAPPEATNDEVSSSGALVAEIPPEESKPSAANEGYEGTTGSDWDEDEASDYEYEDDDDIGFSGFLVSGPAPARIEQEQEPKPPTKWKEPTREAVDMSLRAQSEPSGGKRRLAQDLYKIMNQDTEEAGFSLAPSSEDSMDLWTIKLFQFDEESNLSKDMRVLNIDHIQLEMKFPDQYPFEPPFVRVVRPRFKRQTGFVMNGALCMELLTKEGWNPINDIESVIVSIRSLLVVGDGRLSAATDLNEERYNALLEASKTDDGKEPAAKKAKDDNEKASEPKEVPKPVTKEQVGSYTASEAQSAYSHLSDYHKKKGWDNSGWWARKG